jgi:hypothetical protein
MHEQQAGLGQQVRQKQVQQQRAARPLLTCSLLVLTLCDLWKVAHKQKKRNDLQPLHATLFFLDKVNSAKQPIKTWNCNLKNEN